MKIMICIDGTYVPLICPIVDVQEADVTFFECETDNVIVITPEQFLYNKGGVVK